MLPYLYIYPVLIDLFEILTPTIYWIGFSIVITWMLYISHENLKLTEKNPKNSLVSTTEICKALYKTSINILIGLGFVACCQFFMQTFGGAVEESNFKNQQLLLFELNEKIKDFLSFKSLLIVVFYSGNISFSEKNNNIK